MDALSRQLRFELERFEATYGSIETIFIGGGTPSTVSAEYYAKLFEILTPYLASDAEISCEANPNSATINWLEQMRLLGVNRITLGVQSFDSKKLKLLGRSHSPNQAIKAIEAAAQAGFKRISLDLIYNCAGDDQALLERDLDIAFSLPISHISAYELTIEKNTPFAKRPEVCKENVALARWMSRSIQERGLKQYEISNFGDACRHNLGYWELKDYIGLGAGAVGFQKNRRYYPSKDIEQYIHNPLSQNCEILSFEELKLEHLFLGFRSKIGVDIKLLSSSERERAQWLVAEGKLLRSAKRYLNPDFFLADELALFVMD